MEKLEGHLFAVQEHDILLVPDIFAFEQIILQEQN